MSYTLEFGLQAKTDRGSFTARTVEEVDAALDRVIAAAVDYGYRHNPTAFVVERPVFGPAEIPDHGLKFDVDPDQRVAALVWVGPGFDQPWMTLSNTPLPKVDLYRDLGIGLRFPANAAITLDQLRAAVHEFHESGGHRPTCVQWQEADGF
ncbi:Imm1 family immunity protein [Streptoalloteichus hindustanus]|uniref:Immunity protein Imm1 n=1 Tax=Streptoalloteichus hindustanus TaxID=2017 RepID=A0A1M5MJQ2_STRHI|nr:Imm1 family immunity protein [Streptoalloteichus hindustanus]SHG77471.1 Immunity protein Imm1 [Streptoalloteichus hindustanus]